MPSPADVGRKIWANLADPFYDRGTNDKGIGIQPACPVNCFTAGTAASHPKILNAK